MRCKNCGDDAAEPDDEGRPSLCDRCWQLVLRANGWSAPLYLGQPRGGRDAAAQDELDRLRLAARERGDI